MTKNFEILQNINSNMIESFNKAINGQDPNNMWENIKENGAKITKQIKDFMLIEEKLHKNLNPEKNENDEPSRTASRTEIKDPEIKEIDLMSKKISLIENIESQKEHNIITEFLRYSPEDFKKPSCKKRMSQLILDTEKTINKFYKKIGLIPEDQSTNFSMEQAKNTYDKITDLLINGNLASN